ncbi:MAG: hypothetical protein BGO43_09680 [Gammaproteobacteria bacterium 39-13]|nr:hypothetical protein [Gammaproteobacteria bacterium]OJV93909.1 MAG: hypothetical protein BGO43_09680 [Gammaproteobacteria bacterium 39-13]
MDKTKVSDNILNFIKLNGPQTAQSLADAFRVTPMAIRQHLYLHNKNGLIDYHDQKPIRGRPKRLWSLTELAEKKYVDNTHFQMSITLKAILDHNIMNEKQLIKLYEETLFSRFPHTAKQARQFGLDMNIGKLISVLCQEASNLGYLFEYTEIGRAEYLLTEHHEPLKLISQKHEFIKNIECNKYNIILGENFHVDCISHILSGHYCSKYKLTKRM